MWGIFFTQTPPLPEKECGGLLGGDSVIVSENVRGASPGRQNENHWLDVKSQHYDLASGAGQFG